MAESGEKLFFSPPVSMVSLRTHLSTWKEKALDPAAHSPASWCCGPPGWCWLSCTENRVEVWGAWSHRRYSPGAVTDQRLQGRATEGKLRWQTALGEWPCVLCFSMTWVQGFWELSQEYCEINCCIQYASKFGKLSSGHRTGKGQFSFQSQRKAMQNNAQTTTQLHSSHMLVK